MSEGSSIVSLAYDTENEELSITLSGAASDGDIIMFNMLEDEEIDGIVAADGNPLAEQAFERQEGLWVEVDAAEGPNVSILLYEDSEFTTIASSFAPGSTVYVRIDDPSGPGQAGSTAYALAVSTADETGISIECTDPDGNNFFYGGFQVTGQDSTTELSNLKVNLESGDTLTVDYGMPPNDASAQAVTTPAPASAQAPDGVNLQVEFGSLVLNIDPKLGETLLGLDSIGINESTSKVLIYNWEDEANAIEMTLAQLESAADASVDLQSNSVTLEGDPSFATELFSNGGLLEDFQFQYHDTVRVMLYGTAGEAAYGPIEAVAGIPYIFIVDETEEEDGTLTAGINNNYGLAISGTYDDIVIGGQIFTPDESGASMLAALGNAIAGNLTSIADAGGETGRIKAFYLATTMEGYSMENVESLSVTLDAATPGIILSASKTTTSEPVNAMVTLFVIDAVKGGMDSVSFNLESAESEEGVSVLLDSNPGEGMQTDIGSDGTISWPEVVDASEFFIEVYKDGSEEPWATETVIGSNSLPYAEELYDLGAGTYSATATIFGGTMDNTVIQSGETYTVQKQATVTGLAFTGKTLNWDNLAFNNGVTITIYSGATEDGLEATGESVQTLNDGESGYDLSAYITESIYYGATLIADGSGYMLISSDESGMAIYNNDAEMPTAGDPAIETSDEDLSGTYDSGDTITLSFSEPIDFTNFTAISDFALSAGTWGNTTISNASKDGDSDYTNSIVITLQDESSIQGLATITIEAAKVLDARGNAAESNLVYTLPELDQPTNPGPALTLGTTSYNTDETITITYDTTDFGTYHGEVYQIHVDNTDDSYVGMIPEADWTATAGQIAISFSETNPLSTSGNYKIRIKATGYDENVTGIVSTTFGNPEQLAFKSGSEPASPDENGGALAEIIVEALDQYGNKCIALSTGAVTAEKRTGFINDWAWNLSGTLTANFASGEAAFTGINVESIDSQSVYLQFSYDDFDNIYGSIIIPIPTDEAPDLNILAQFGDTEGFANGVVVTLGEPAIEGNTFKFISTSSTISVPTGFDASAWDDIASGETIAQEVSNRIIGIAEVDSAGHVARFSESNRLGSIYGQVTGTSDNSGITVTVKKYSGDIQLGSAIVDTTDEDGWYAIRGLDMYFVEGYKFTIEFSKDGYYDPDSPRTVVETDFTDSKRSINPVIYGPEDIFNVIRGRAVHSDDITSGVEGLRVMIGLHSGFTPETQAGVEMTFMTSTDSNGYFQFTNVIKDPDEYTQVRFYQWSPGLSRYYLVNGDSNNYDYEIITEYREGYSDKNLDWNDVENLWEFRESAHFIVDDLYYHTN